MSKTAIVGAGALGKLVLNILYTRRGGSDYIFVDDNEEGIHAGFSVYGTVDEFIEEHGRKTYYEAIVAVGDIEDRKELYYRISDETSLEIISAIDRSARLSNVTPNIIGRGTTVKENAVIEPDAQIGVNCIIGNNSTICHDVEIGNHCRISPGVTIAGGAKIGDEVYLCPGVTVDKGIEIADRVTVLSGTSVYKSVNDPGAMFNQEQLNQKP